MRATRSRVTVGFVLGGILLSGLWLGEGFAKNKGPQRPTKAFNALHGRPRTRTILRFS